MAREPMIPPQPDDGRTSAQRFNSFAKKLLSVPKAQIDELETNKGDAGNTQKSKKRKSR